MQTYRFDPSDRDGEKNVQRERWRLRALRPHGDIKLLLVSEKYEDCFRNHYNDMKTYRDSCCGELVLSSLDFYGMS
jgi:hypothetical protein